MSTHPVKAARGRRRSCWATPETLSATHRATPRNKPLARGGAPCYDRRTLGKRLLVTAYRKRSATHRGRGMTDGTRARGTLTIYDVAHRAGVSIASVSRVLNGQGSPRRETRGRVVRAVRELSFVPDGAARALSNGLKEVVGVVFRRGGETAFEDVDESLLFIDVVNRGIEVAAQRRGFDVLMSSVGVHDDTVPSRTAAIAGKADGLILHDRMLTPSGIVRLASMVPIVTLAGSPTPASINVRCDNESGMRALVRHLVVDHGYRSVAYLS